MGLETATFISELVAANPLGTDKKNQGDDHITLIKRVLQATFLRSSKAFSFPGTVAKSADYTVLATDDNLTFLCTTTAAFTLTLPVLAAGDAGWHIDVMKVTTDANPVFIVPPSGTINGFTKIRRSVEWAVTRVLWTGSVFAATRTFGVPIGSEIPYHGSTLPNGCVWPNGGAVSATTQVELTAVIGATLPDLRGRFGLAADNLGTAATRNTTLPNAGTTGGSERITLAQSDLPNVAPAVSGTSGALSGASGTQNIPTAAGVNIFGVPSNHTATIINTGGAGTFSTYSSTDFITLDNTQTISVGGGTVSAGTFAVRINGNQTQTAVNITPLAYTRRVVIVGE